MKNSKIIFLAVLFLFVLVFQSCNKEKVYDRPTQLIENDFAKQLNTNYNRYTASIPNNGKEDANAIWYSVEELERYLYYIKTQGAKKGYKVDGIRIYLGKYPEDRTKYNDKAGMTTVFLSPTGKKATTQEAGMLSFQGSTEDQHADVTELSPLNYGSMGNPPKITYPLQ